MVSELLSHLLDVGGLGFGVLVLVLCLRQFQQQNQQLFGLIQLNAKHSTEHIQQALNKISQRIP
jgi:hypothetical protein